MFTDGCETGNIALVKLLLEHGAAVDETTVYDDGSAERTPKKAQNYMDLVKF